LRRASLRHTIRHNPQGNREAGKQHNALCCGNHFDHSMERAAGTQLPPGTKVNCSADKQLLQLRVLGFRLLQDGDVGVGVFQWELWSRCAKNLFWHCFAVDSNSLNSGVPRNFTSSGSFCKAV
jgi:hypothetical protein